MIIDLVDTDFDTLPEEIVIERDCPCLPDLVLSPSDGTLFFSEEGIPADVTALEEGQDVVVFGSMNSEGLVDVLFIKIGGVLTLTGTALTDAADGDFVLSLDSGQVVDGEVTVEIPDAGAVLIQDPCGSMMSRDDIMVDSDITVIGLLDADLDSMAPFAILILPGD